jgi:hypothetical protein
MPFVAECLFCQTKVRVPDRAVGMSIPCPRCGCAFTVVPLDGVPAEASLPDHPRADALAPAARGRLPDLSAGGAAPESVAAPAGPILSPLGVVSVLLASSGLALLSLPGLRPFTLALGGLALAAAVLGLALRGNANRGRVFFPAAGMVLGVPVVAIASFWPNLLSPKPPAEYTPPPAVAKPSPEWVDAAKHFAQRGDLRVRLLRVTLGPVAFARAPQGPTPDELLQISFRVYNAGATGRLEYRGWGQPAASPLEGAVLQDDRGRQVRSYSFGPGVEVAGQLRSASIVPLGKVEDVLVFEPPDGRVEFLRLELPASAGGAAGTLRFEIPRALFRGL